MRTSSRVLWRGCKDAQSHRGHAARGLVGCVRGNGAWIVSRCMYLCSVLYLRSEMAARGCQWWDSVASYVLLAAYSTPIDDLMG